MPTSSAKSISNVNSRFKKKIDVKCWCEDLCPAFVSRTPKSPRKKFWGCPNYKVDDEGVQKKRYDARVKSDYRSAINDDINANGCCFVRGYIIHACSSSIQDLMAVGCYATSIVILKYVAFDGMKYLAFDGI
uniref:Zinc finger GRF-type domain-containing protein n=1 Tax=Lactuca sativa TaxID=4236 RepID=A0A9R1X3L6_LACSA|nr:hypothetical protein LSAT_V11C700376250 [Lactuca sativa]